jgi:hypothetical protein
VRQSLLALIALSTVAIPCPADQAATPAETLIRLKIQPTPEPKPALRYLLLPELKEMNPGNPVQNYFKCFMEQQKFFFDKDAFERREKLLAMPLAELKTQDLKAYSGFALTQADWAARLDQPDWQVLLRVKRDGVSLDIPEVQQLRALASALKVRCRFEVANGRFDDAIRTAKTMFAMARHLGEHPTLVGNLVGFSMANSAITVVDEMVQQSGCPNLYWALATLPDPLVRLDKGIEGERALVLTEFRDLDRNAPMSGEQLKKFIAHLEVLIGAGNPPEPGKGVQAWLDARSKDEETVRAARRRLVESGLADSPMHPRFSAEQLLLLDELREFEVRRDDIMKLMVLPAWQAEALSSRQAKPARDPALFEKALLEGVYGTCMAQARLCQRLALLRHVEALRVYTADHNGTLPAKLSEISVPLPDDPFTGKPFRYEANGTTAHLRGTPPPSMESEPAYKVHYELTVRK